MSWNRPRSHVAVLLFSLALGGLLVEAALRYICVVCTWTEQNAGRYVSPYREPPDKSWYHLRPRDQVSSYRQPEFDYELRTNSLGIRDSEHPVAKPPGELRIIGLGDSFTEGQGARYEDSYLKVLERNLNRRLKGNRVRVINGGVAGSDPFYCYRLLVDKLLVYEPDLVTLAINNSDVMDVIARGGSERFLADGTIRFADPPRDEWLYGTSHLYRVVGMVLFGYDWYGLSPSRKLAESERSIEKLEGLLDEYRELARREEFRFLVILHPEFYELSTRRYVFDAARLKRHSIESDIHVLDLLEYFSETLGSGSETPETLYWEKDFHHNRAGYELFAKGVEEYLLHNGFFELGS